MKIEIKMPRLGVNDDLIFLARWEVADGDEVSKGQIIADVETTKETSEITASAAGHIRILADEGQDVKVGDIIAVISDDGEGVMKGNLICAGAIIGSEATIGDNCIINAGAIVSHDCTIHDSCHIASGAVLAGNVTVGENTLIGQNCTIYSDVVIGKNVVIQNGCHVFKNVGDNEIVTHI